MKGKNMDEKNKNGNQMNMNHNMYPRLLIMSLLHLISMYFLMYSMVYVFDHFYNNINKFYMAAIMTAPMILLELVLMGAMYKNKTRNAVIMIGSIAALVIFFLFIRQQTAVNDRMFLRSMIPHHSSAILMCEETELQDQELIDLCDEIVQTQKEEIDQMKDIMERLQNP